MSRSKHLEVPPIIDDVGERDERGQATAEYALLTGAIALVITAVAAWAASTGKIGRLLDLVFDHLARAVG
ncbi:MAG: hypothetical protein P8N02_13780 [Actinomycetota bacterium]|jgi:Flp pilus assembly pilin Flp|nr:hypothetical protein [Actinomycetota bacterium]